MKAIVQTRAARLTRPAAVSKLVDAFLAGRSPRTMAAYRTDLADFARYVPAPSPEDAARKLLGSAPGDANSLVLGYRSHLTDHGLAPATVNRRLAAIRSLVKLARTLGMVVWSLEVPGLRSQPYRDTRGPGFLGVRAMLRQLAKRTDAKGIRDRAIIRLLFDRGLRRGEVVSLDLEHLDLDAATVSVMGKGKREREPLTLAPPTVAALKAWVAARGDSPGPLFQNLDRGHEHGRRLTGQAVYGLVRALGDDVGVRARPHGLRHAGITAGLDRTGGDLRAVQRFSRHSDVRTLGLYDDNREDLGGRVTRLVAEE
jgi:integrase/recombinase XerC